MLTVHVRRAGHAAPRQARPGRRAPPATSRPPPTSRSSTPSCTSRRVNASGPPRARPHRRAGPRLPVGRAQQAHGDDRRDPGRRDLLAGAPGRVLRSSRPASSRPPTTTSSALEIETDGSITPRDALASAGDTLRNLVEPRRRPVRRAAGLELGEVVADHADVARPRAADRGARPVRAAAQLPQAGAGRHDRPAGAEDRGRPARASRTSVRSRSKRCMQKLDERGLSLRVKGSEPTMPAPKKGRASVGTPRTSSCMLANLAASLFEASAITTTEAKAKALRPYAEKLITKAKKGGVHEQRQVVATHPRQARDAQAVRRDRARATPTATAATCGSSSSAPRRRRRAHGASSWSDPLRASSACAPPAGRLAEARDLREDPGAG
mgnify:CR=1 FL=1